MARFHPILQLEVGQFSDPGRQRQNNEDWLGTFQPDDAKRLADKGSLFLVADGMGGHRSGELASRRAVDQVIRGYTYSASDDVTAALLRSIQVANSTLYQAAGQAGRQRWGTTLVAAVVRRDQLWIANVGDSRAYLHREGTLLQLSRDHTLAAELNVASMEEGAGRHLITRALGLKPRVQAYVSDVPIALQPGDQILLCSDGLTTPLSTAEIRDILVQYPAREAATALVQAANARGGPDNISAIVIGVGGAREAAPKRSPGTWLSALVQRETWRQAAADMQHLMAGGRSRWPLVVIILAALVAVLGLIALGFAFGWILFQ